jgi:hypothetical protein
VDAHALLGPAVVALLVICLALIAFNLILYRRILARLRGEHYDYWKELGSSRWLPRLTTPSQRKRFDALLWRGDESLPSDPALTLSLKQYRLVLRAYSVTVFLLFVGIVLLALLGWS